MTKDYSDIIQEQVNMPPRRKSWRELVQAMKTYLGKLQTVASNRASKAQSQLAATKANLKTYQKSIKKQRNYGTRTGIAIKS